MARTLNPVAHAVRRDAFLDAAQRLIQTKGYEALSIQDVLDAVGSSKGAFYHYFDSKSALLEGVISRMVDAALAELGPIFNDPQLSATAETRCLFGRPGKLQGPAHRFAARGHPRLAVRRQRDRSREVQAPCGSLADAVHGGSHPARGSRGSFGVDDADGAARVFVALLLELNKLATELFLARQAGTVTLDEVERQFNAFRAALERILDAQPGSLTLVDEATIRYWFGLPG